MTTPSKPGKQPRPVWVLVGATAGYEAAIRDAGGRRYQGEWSFWADPTEALAGAERQSFAERLETEREHAADRADRYSDYAEHAGQRRDAAFDAAHKAVEHIPLGQPILVLHHSERSHRAAIKRSHAAMDRACAEAKKADYWQHRTQSAERQAIAPVRIDFAVRRRDEAAAEVRDCERKLTRGRDRDLMLDYHTPEFQDYLRQLEASLTDAQERVVYWQSLIDEAGGIPFGPHNVRHGDRIKTSLGWYTVRRCNQKTATVETGYSWHGKVPWEDVIEAQPAGQSESA